jgi:hypothetical protein
MTVLAEGLIHRSLGQSEAPPQEIGPVAFVWLQAIFIFSLHLTR